MVQELRAEWQSSQEEDDEAADIENSDRDEEINYLESFSFTGT
jgi:hypothetical protein